MPQSVESTLSGHLGAATAGTGAHIDTGSPSHTLCVDSLLSQFNAAALAIGADGNIAALNAGASELLGKRIVGLPWDVLSRALFSAKNEPATLPDGTVVSAIDADPLASGERVVLLLEHSKPGIHFTPVSSPDAVLAHQLRTPLSTAVLYVSRMAGESALSSQHRRWLQRTQEQLTAAERMVDNLLMFARQSAFATETLSLSEIVSGARASCEAQIREAEMACSVDGPNDVLPVLGNRVALVSAVSNIITNACRHAPGSSLRLSSRLNANGRGEITVRDTGSGFPTDDKAHASQVPSAADGNGLGLSVARHVIEQHGGCLTATNHPDGGAYLCVELPLARCAADSVEVSI